MRYRFSSVGFAIGDRLGQALGAAAPEAESLGMQPGN